MPVELKVPAVGESITEVMIGQWRKKVGDKVERDEELVEVETDKATVDIPAPAAGVLTKILKQAGETAAVGEAIGEIGDATETTGEVKTKSPPEVSPAKEQAQPAERPAPKQEASARKSEAAPASKATEPSGRRMTEGPRPEPRPSSRATPALPSSGAPGRAERLVPMSPMRKRIAQRLVEAQQNAALVTTFNEIDMSAVIHLRKKHGDPFKEAYGVKLGFMSFFVKAVVGALSEVPQVNAEIRGTDLVYRDYCDIGVAVGGGKGLVVPILRNAERMSFADIERAIADFGRRAADNDIALEELQGGPFTISNGGIYGSLLSTPIVNPPQSGVLGMHKIQERPVAVDGQVVIRPMMYVALTYDHRVVDGREAVTFLIRIKEIVEDPARLVIEV